MRKNFLNKLLVGALVFGSVLSLNPLVAKAESGDTSFEENGVYYGSLEAKKASDEYEVKVYAIENGIKIGWDMGKDHKWHYYNQNGKMQKNTTIIEDGKKYVIDENGDWIQ